MNTLQEWMLIRVLIGVGLVVVMVIGCALVARLTGRRPSAPNRERLELPAGPSACGPVLRYHVDTAGSVANDSEVDPTPTPVAPRHAA